MQVIKLNDDIYSTFIIYTASEWKKEVYKSHDIYDKTIRVNLITGKRGTTLIFENKHFLVVSDNAILKKMQFGAIIKLLDIVSWTKRPPKKLTRQIILFFGLDSTKQRTRKNIKRCKYMRYKIEKIAKRNNLGYSIVKFDGGFKGYEFSANSYNEKAFLKSLFRAKDLYIRGNPYSYYFTVMYLDDYLSLKKFDKMVFRLVDMFNQALHDGKTATEAKNIQLHFCALCPEYFPAYENIYNEIA